MERHFVTFAVVVEVEVEDGTPFSEALELAQAEFGALGDHREFNVDFHYSVNAETGDETEY